jgi:hypothetical protein
LEGLVENEFSAPLWQAIYFASLPTAEDQKE